MNMSNTENTVAPSIGRIVLVRGEPICATDPWREYPAIITRVVDQNFVDVAVFQGPSVPCFVPAQTEVAKRHLGMEIPYRAYIAMKTVDGDVVPWVASQTDILAEDWCC